MKGWVVAKDQIIVRISAAMTFRTQWATLVVTLAWQATVGESTDQWVAQDQTTSRICFAICHGWTVGVAATHATKMQIRKFNDSS